MALILRCTECHEGYRYLTGAFPLVCPLCKKPTAWTGATISTDPAADPATPYELTEEDVRILRVQRINPERPLDGSREER